MKILIVVLLSLPAPLTWAKSTTAKPAHRSEVTESDVPKAGEIGVGSMIGTIISATGKYWLSDQAALDFGIGFVGSSWVIVYGDYLWHLPRIFGTNSQFGRDSSLYFGGGGGVGFWNGYGACGHWECDWSSHTSNSGAGLFIRGVSGVEWYPQTTRFGVFGELGPTIMIVPGTWGTIDVAVGGRYYF